MKKTCFSCKIDLPLTDFSKSKMKYQLKTDFGRMRVCKVCTMKKVINTLKTVMYNFKERKFEVIEFKTKTEAIEYLVKNKSI